MTAKCVHENRHQSLSGSDSKSNTPNSQQRPTNDGNVGGGECDSRCSSGGAFTMKPKSVEGEMMSKESSPEYDDKTSTNAREKRLKSLTRKISCPQINMNSWSGVQTEEGYSSGSVTLPESGTQYLALVGSLLSELSPDSDLNQMYFIEIALVSSIQSLKLSLDFYRFFMFHSKCQRLSEPVAAFLQTGGKASDSIIDDNTNERLYLQNLYLDTLEVETMLYDCLDRFRHYKGRAFATKHIQKLQKAVNKVKNSQNQGIFSL